jgi:hypothetical protein
VFFNFFILFLLIYFFFSISFYIYRKSPNDICPVYGQPCGSTQICARGFYCKANAIGANGAYTGICVTNSDLKTIDGVYGKPCTLGNDIPDCVYYNPLAINPSSNPSALSCIRAFPTDNVGTCRIGPNKDGDPCNLNAECASGVCEISLGVCKGLAEGEVCYPGFPDPCQPQHFCLSAGGSSGICTKSISNGRACSTSNSCERGTFCAGQDPSTPRCVSPFTAPDYAYTAIAPWMCTSGSAIMITPATSSSSAVYQCLPTNATSLTTKYCNIGVPPPAGYSCDCTSSGQNQLHPIGNLGQFSATSAPAVRNLFTCLVNANGIMGSPCQFDAGDLTSVRYGSCAYYACFPYYQALTNISGIQPFLPPLISWADRSSCEIDAIKAYFSATTSAPCIVLPRLEEWTCAYIVQPSGIAGTSGLVAVIIIGVIVGFIGHMIAFRKENNTKLPSWLQF